MSTSLFIDAIMAFFLALTPQAEPAPAQKGDSPAPVVTAPAPQAVVAPSCSVTTRRNGSEGVSIALTAGSTPIQGEVMFTAQTRQGTNHIRQRSADMVDLNAGGTLQHSLGFTVNGRTDPVVTVTLPDDQVLPCT